MKPNFWKTANREYNLHRFDNAVAKYVMCQSDVQPKPQDYDLMPNTDPAFKKPAGTFAALVRKQRGETETPQTPAPEPEKKKPFRFAVDLHGTGITKKALEKTIRAQETQLDKAAKVSTPDPHDIVERATQLDAEALQLKEKELGKNITLDEYQKAALVGLQRQKFGCLIGAAGTGKTTVERELAEVLEESTPVVDINDAKLPGQRTDTRDMRAAICFCAFTGRAVQQMKRALPRKYHSTCATIHATLGYAPVIEEVFDKETQQWKEVKRFRPTFTAQNKLPFKVAVMDETGMTGIGLWNEFIAALPDDCRIILIGDINQLPPVQDRSVLGFAMLNWPTFALEKIHRQAADNPIIANAHRILRGEMPQKDAKKFAMVNMPDSSVGTYEKMFKRPGCIIDQLVQKDLFDPFRDAIIVPTNKGTLGQLHLNEHLVMKFNPAKTTEDGIVLNPRQIITAGWVHVAFAVGDKVMLLQNDRQRNLTNGMTGVVKEIQKNPNFMPTKSAHANVNTAASFDGVELEEVEDFLNETKLENVPDKDDEDEGQRPASHIMVVRFGSGDFMQEVSFQTAGQYRQVTLAYAFTCHKSQGGEYPNVVILCHSANLRMLTREWLYTAVTRAQERVILCCNDRGIRQALRIQRIKGKTVKEKAMKFLELESLEDVKLPYLPQAEEI